MGELRPITEAEFRAFDASVDSRAGYYGSRWCYYSKAIDFVLERKPRTLLEIGCYLLPVFSGCDTMDILSFDNRGPTYRHDAGVAPWPIADKAYDMVLALQVWEHLGGRQQAAFAEAMRTAHGALLSFPLEWTNCPESDDHHNITEATIREWTLHAEPCRRAVVERALPGRETARHLVLCFEF